MIFSIGVPRLRTLDRTPSYCHVSEYQLCLLRSHLDSSLIFENIALSVSSKLPFGRLKNNVLRVFFVPPRLIARSFVISQFIEKRGKRRMLWMTTAPTSNGP
ncbi:hypothetical protein AB6A40_008989 [Gnathostoma spinigerum]|uniref:Uncharacterized protein n=1 Tax=Gnathostoma spinigerum TaxID=75299 RepID=A0ABD6EQN0_9BILA